VANALRPTIGAHSLTWTLFFPRSWYMTFVMMAAEMRLGIDFPVGDLSHFWPRTDVTLGDAEKQA
jgi:hypothetical protein